MNSLYSCLSRLREDGTDEGEQYTSGANKKYYFHTQNNTLEIIRTRPSNSGRRTQEQSFRCKNETGNNQSIIQPIRTVADEIVQRQAPLAGTVGQVQLGLRKMEPVQVMLERNDGGGDQPLFAGQPFVSYSSGVVVRSAPSSVAHANRLTGHVMTQSHLVAARGGGSSNTVLHPSNNIVVNGVNTNLVTHASGEMTHPGLVTDAGHVAFAGIDGHAMADQQADDDPSVTESILQQSNSVIDNSISTSLSSVTLTSSSVPTALLASSTLSSSLFTAAAPASVTVPLVSTPVSESLYSMRSGGDSYSQIVIDVTESGEVTKQVVTRTSLETTGKTEHAQSGLTWTTSRDRLIGNQPVMASATSIPGSSHGAQVETVVTGHVAGANQTLLQQHGGPNHTYIQTDQLHSHEERPVMLTDETASSIGESGLFIIDSLTHVPPTTVNNRLCQRSDSLKEDGPHTVSLESSVLGKGSLPVTHESSSLGKNGHDASDNNQLPYILIDTSKRVPVSLADGPFTNVQDPSGSTDEGNPQLNEAEIISTSSTKADHQTTISDVKISSTTPMAVKAVQLNGITGDVGTGFGCPYCSYTSNKRSNINMHVRTIHLKEKFSCSICNKKVTNLNQHMRLIHKIYKARGELCVLCNKYVLNLKNHETKVHSESVKQNLICQVCQKNFTTSQNLNRHMETVHSQSKKITCEKCNVAVSDIARHNASFHSLPSSQPFICGICGFEFNKRSLFLSHKMRHKKSSGRARVLKHCKECGKFFSNINQHNKIIHKKVKTFECVNCQKRFFDKRELRNHHLKYLRLGECTKPPTAGGAKVGRYPCSHCNYRSNRKSNLLAHEEAKHLGIRYNCSACGQLLSTKTNLINHIKTCEAYIIQHGYVGTSKRVVFFCKLCDYQTVRATHLDRHILSVHPTQAVETVTNVYEASKAVSSDYDAGQFGSNSFTSVGQEQVALSKHVKLPQFVNLAHLEPAHIVTPQPPSIHQSDQTSTSTAMESILQPGQQLEVNLKHHRHLSAVQQQNPTTVSSVTGITSEDEVSLGLQHRQALAATEVDQVGTPDFSSQEDAKAGLGLEARGGFQVSDVGQTPTTSSINGVKMGTDRNVFNVNLHHAIEENHIGTTADMVEHVMCDVSAAHEHLTSQHDLEERHETPPDIEPRHVPPASNELEQRHIPTHGYDCREAVSSVVGRLGRFASAAGAGDAADGCQYQQQQQSQAAVVSSRRISENHMLSSALSDFYGIHEDAASLFGLQLPLEDFHTSLSIPHHHINNIQQSSPDKFTFSPTVRN